VLHKEVTSPHGLGLVLQEASQGFALSVPPDYPLSLR
jgi:hypothetical protein